VVARQAHSEPRRGGTQSRTRAPTRDPRCSRDYLIRSRRQR
jgi:hypothetical protein